ncbi:hypothetical protein T459_21665 [Capsicum annuum]|uniref:Uncharacterized protein n=1 Tax=Capsicum annuum TaxID=4072 RepID=A0A2G2YXA2_CAPAN|nr:hypothetical protein T459_21665 [Capsicum annuum]
MQIVSEEKYPLMLRYVACTTPQYTIVVKFIHSNKSKSSKGGVEAFSLEHELPSNNDSEDKRFSVLNEKFDVICSKKFTKILDENKILKSELSKIKRLLLGKIKEDGKIQSDKQLDNLQAEPSHDPMVHNQSDDPHKPTKNERSKKKRRVEEGKNVEAHSNEKEEAAEERVIGLSPQNMEDMRQAKNQGFCGIEVDGDIIYGTKDCGNVNSIINNVISSVFTASSSLPTSPDVKSTQAERSELGDINVDTEDIIFDVDGTKKFVNIDSIICNIEISHDEQESSRVSPF